MNSKTSRDIIQELKRKQLDNHHGAPKLSHKQLRKLIKKERRKVKRSAFNKTYTEKKLGFERTTNVASTSGESSEEISSKGSDKGSQFCRTLDDKKQLASERALQILRRKFSK
jgi:hypothetical protein